MAATRYENEASGRSPQRVQEGLSLPVFNSLPAAAGLSNAEAFQFSLRHALALLPRMLTVRDAAAKADSVGRFSLR